MGAGSKSPRAQENDVAEGYHQKEAGLDEDAG
jgi:hypothetical protein